MKIVFTFESECEIQGLFTNAFAWYHSHRKLIKLNTHDYAGTSIILSPQTIHSTFMKCKTQGAGYSTFMMIEKRVAKNFSNFILYEMLKNKQHLVKELGNKLNLNGHRLKS